MDQPNPAAFNIANSSNVSQIYNTFYHVLNELEPFAQIEGVRLAIDYQGRTFVCGQNFDMQLQSNFSLHRELRLEIQGIIAKYCPRTGL